jgi:hypothetical protein
MELKVRTFQNSLDLTGFVNATGIVQANIQTILVGVDNYLYLFYWA